MPFTISHAVVAPAFRRTPLPASAVAAGAMAPDLPLYAPVGVRYGTTHEVWAAPTLDVLLALLLLVLWGTVLRPAVVAVLPLGIAERLPLGSYRPTVPRPTPAVLAALAVGALTHVVWDAFTHPGWWGAALAPVLDRPLAGLAIASWAHVASSIGGLVLLAAWATRRLRNEQRVTRDPALTPFARRGLATVTLTALALGGLAGGLGTADERAAAIAISAATGGIVSAGAVLIVTGTALLASRRPR